MTKATKWLTDVTWSTVQADVADLKPYDRNPRTITKDAFERLVTRIREEGFRAPITTDGKGTILAGHQRYRAAKELGYSKLPVMIPSRPLTKEECAQIVVADNVSHGDWDMDMLAADFDVMDLAEWGVELPDITQLDPEEIEEDEAPEPPAIPKTVLGDVWVLGRHRLMCGSSVEATAIDKLVGTNSVDMIYTDPPYGISEKGDRSARGGLTKGNNLKDFIDDSTSYAVDAFNYCSSLDIPVQVWWGANYYADRLPPSANWIVWDKRVEDKQRDTQSDCELAWAKSRFSSVRIFRHLWKGLIKQSEHGQKRVHPTQKPVALAVWAFEELSGGSIILDLFGGSGSTLIAAEQTSRSCLMMELDPHYCDVIIQRWQHLTGQKAVHAETGEEF